MGMKQALRRTLILAAIMSLALLAGCGGSTVTQTTKTEHYNVQLSLDGTGSGERTATITVNDFAGQPITADSVVLAPVMQQMGMALPETTAQMIAPGQYQAKGEFFQMVGEWRMDVRVSAGGNQEVADFKVQVAQ
jgi:ABC-type phosphate transport system substrate-binding protein